MYDVWQSCRAMQKDLRRSKLKTTVKARNYFQATNTRNIEVSFAKEVYLNVNPLLFFANIYVNIWQNSAASGSHSAPRQRTEELISTSLAKLWFNPYYNMTSTIFVNNCLYILRNTDEWNFVYSRAIEVCIVRIKWFVTFSFRHRTPTAIFDFKLQNSIAP